MVIKVKALTNYYKMYILSSGNYACLVVCLSYESMFSYIEELQAELGAKGIKKGEILIDQLLISGNGKNRFLSIEVENGYFLYTTAKNVIVDQYYHQLTSSELMRNQVLLENSILTPKQISMISRGCAI
jgi:hypothetical protein